MVFSIIQAILLYPFFSVYIYFFIFFDIIYINNIFGGTGFQVTGMIPLDCVGGTGTLFSGTILSGDISPGISANGESCAFPTTGKSLS